MRNNQSTNQCADQSCSFKSTFLCSEKALTTRAVSVRGNLLESSKVKAYSKNNFSLERVDSRVQHTWRLRVVGSCFYEGLKLKTPASLSLYSESLTLIPSFSIIYNYKVVNWLFIEVIRERSLLSINALLRFLVKEFPLFREKLS